MTLEEKAERYDELLLKLQKAKVDDNVCDEMYYRVIDDIVPELKESEDDRIREVLIDYFKKYKEQEECGIKTFYGIPADDILAWLEKQQKSADKVEPKFKVKYADSEYNVLEVKDIAGVTFYGIEDEPNHIDYVKADNCEIISGYGIKESGLSFPTKPVMFSEQNPAWSEEDEKIVLSIEQVMNCASLLNIVPEKIDKIKTWLKSLKERVQPQNKCKKSLATADLENSLCDIQDGFSDTSYEYRILGKAIEFIRCTEPKPQWKPSDEQMEALLYISRYYAPTETDKLGWESLQTLELMLNQLKKLK